MTALIRRILIAGATVAVLGLAIVGAGALAEPRASGPETAVTAAEAILATDAAPTTPNRPPVGDLRRLAGWRRLVHASATLDLPALGGLTTIQLDHGTIRSVDGSSLTIAEAGGAAITISLGDDSRVRREGAKAQMADLRVGDEVFAMSRVESAGTEAYLVVVAKD